jgi:hypothetical protein
MVAGLRNRPARRPKSPVPGMIVGLAGLMLSGSMFVNAKADLQAYAADPTCVAGLVATLPAAGQCRTEEVLISRIYRTTGRHSHRYVVLGLADGSQLTVSYGRDQYGNVWSGVARRDDRTANAQLFRDKIVTLETRSGRADTADMPADRLNLWGLFGIICGGIGFISALMCLRPSARPLTLHLQRASDEQPIRS